MWHFGLVVYCLRAEYARTVYVHLCINFFMYLCMYASTHPHPHARVCVCLCVCVCVCVCAMDACIKFCMYLCIYASTHTCVCGCVFWMHARTYTHHPPTHATHTQGYSHTSTTHPDVSCIAPTVACSDRNRHSHTTRTQTQPHRHRKSYNKD
jgi:hypothetical protein